VTLPERPPNLVLMTWKVPLGLYIDVLSVICRAHPQATIEEDGNCCTIMLAPNEPLHAGTNSTETAQPGCAAGVSVGVSVGESADPPIATGDLPAVAVTAAAPSEVTPDAQPRLGASDGNAAVDTQTGSDGTASGMTHPYDELWYCREDGCRKSFDTPGRLNAHIQAVHANGGFACGVVGCGEMFMTKAGRSSHLRSMHSVLKPKPAPAPPPAPVPVRIATTQTEIEAAWEERAAQQMSKTNPYKCSCGLELTDYDAWKLHTRKNDGHKLTVSPNANKPTSFVPSGIPRKPVDEDDARLRAGSAM